MSNLAQMEAYQQHLSELEQKKAYLYQQIQTNLGDLAHICGQISALLMTVDWEDTETTWLDIFALAWAYEAGCDQGMRLLAEYKKTKAQWEELDQDLLSLRLELFEDLFCSANGLHDDGAAARI